MKTLVFMGDSITDCGRNTCGSAGYPPKLYGPGYPGLIASKLLGEHPEDNWQIYNRGISGDRIVDLYARWKRDALNLKPDYISMLIGVNDVWHEKSSQDGVEPERFEQFYRMLMDWTLKELPAVKFILMEPFVLPFGAVTGQEWIDDVAIRSRIVKQISQDYKTAFVPLQSIFNEAVKRAPMEYWLVDGVHPQPAGHQLVTNGWCEAASTIGINI